MLPARPIIKPLFTLFSRVALAVAASSAAVGQTDDDSLTKSWYQIELLVFQQTLGATDTQETWPIDIVLAYPPKTVLITDPSNPIEEPIDTAEQEFLTVQDPTIVALETAPSTLITTDDPALATEDRQEPEILADNAIEQPVADEPAQPIYEDPFVLLEATEYELTDAASRLKRSARNRLLTHIAWRQEATSRETPIPVVITGGDQFGDHFELEGTVTLTAARFLHFGTNLWLTQFYPNYGQASAFNQWPALPDIPTPYKAEPVEQAPLTFNTWRQTNPQQGFAIDTRADDYEFSGPDYLVEQIIVNQQSRKMRSSEVHYLDHPALGVIVLVTPRERVITNESELEENLEPAIIAEEKASSSQL